MVLKKQEKTKIISDFKIKDNDTGSADVQIAVLTERIKYLTDHLKEHKHDNHTRLGLLKMVGRRRKLLDYIKKNDPDKYLNLIKRLKIRK